MYLRKIYFEMPQVKDMCCEIKIKGVTKCNTKPKNGFAENNTIFKLRIWNKNIFQANFKLLNEDPK